MWRLYNNHSISQQMDRDLEFIDPLITDPNIQLQIAPRLLSLGLIELCQHICRKKLFHEKLFLEKAKELPAGSTTVSLCLGCVVNLTDVSVDACHRIIDIGLHEDIFTFLNLDSMDPAKVKLCYIRCHLADTAMSVAYNVIQASQQFYIFCVFAKHY